MSSISDSRLTPIALTVPLLAVTVGWMTAQGGSLLVIGAAAVASFFLVVLFVNAGPAALEIEGPVIAILASQLVFRIRGTDELSSNPLDAEGLYRVGMIGAAALLVLIAFMTKVPKERLRGASFWLYVGFVGTAGVGIIMSVNQL